MTRRAVIYYLYGQQNAGDAAIGLGSLAFLEGTDIDVVGVSRWPREFAEYNMDADYYHRYFPKAEIYGGPMAFRRHSGKFSLYASYVRTMSRLLFGGAGRETRSLVKAADLVILNGGNILRCRSMTDFMRLLGILYPLYVARRLGVPYVIFPQSTTKINTVGKWLVGRLLRDARVVWVRERESLREMRSTFPHITFSYAPDVAFNVVRSTAFGRLEEEIALTGENRGLNVAVTLRDHDLGDIEPFPAEKRERIKRTVLSMLEAVRTEVHCTFVLVIQCDKDVAVTREVAESLSERHIAVDVIDTRDVGRLLAIYRQCDLLLGMRVHSIILALSAGTPCAGYFDRSWGLKNPGILSQFELPVAFVGEEEEKGNFQQLFVKLMRERKSVSRQIAEQVVDELKAMREHFDEVVAS